MSLLHHREAARLLVASIISRIPLAAMSVLLIVHAHALTGSYAIAGLVAGANGVAIATASPLLGRLVDRRGQTAVLVLATLACTSALAAAALLPRSAPAAALVLLAAVAGATQPPLGACLRTLWPHVFSDPRDLRAAYALESAALELTYIAGPLLFLAIAAATSSRLSVALLGAVLAVGALAFAAQPASRRWRADHVAGGSRRGSALRSSGLRTLVLVIGLLGVLLGGVEVAVPATAADAGATGATGPLLAVWGVGSLVGGVAAARSGRVGGVRAVVALLLAIAVTHALLAAGGSLLVLGALLAVAGAGIAPLFAVTYALVGEVAVSGTVTEAFAWMTTAISAGVAVGAAAAGGLVEAAGTGPAFVLAGAAAALGAALAATRAPSLHAPVTA